MLFGGDIASASGRSRTHSAVYAVLLRFVDPFLLDEKQRVIEQETNQVCDFLSTSPSPLQWTFVHQFAVLVS